MGSILHEMDDAESLNLANPDLGGPKGHLTIGEGDCVSQWIGDSQCETKCPTSPEHRDLAENVRKKRVDDGKPCRRSWWHSFKARHPKLKGIPMVDGVENAKCEFTRQDVPAYFGELKNALRQMQTPAQLLPLDEIGFCSHPEKARKKKIIYRCDCAMKQAFTEQSDPNHVNLVAAIVFSGEALNRCFEQQLSRISKSRAEPTRL
jgi:hypothetical protein